MSVATALEVLGWLAAHSEAIREVLTALVQGDPLAAEIRLRLPLEGESAKAARELG